MIKYELHTGEFPKPQQVGGVIDIAFDLSYICKSKNL